MSKVFVSYKRVDKDRVFPLVHKMESELGIKFWVDLEGIESDEQFTRVIIKAINECEVFLFMYSKVHEKIIDTERDYTVRELNFAHSRYKHIVFIELESCKLPDWFDFNFPQRQVTQANDSLAMDKLVKNIRNWLNLPRPESSLSPHGLANDESGRGITMGNRGKEHSYDNTSEEAKLLGTSGKSKEKDDGNGSVIKLLQRFGIPLVLLTVLAFFFMVVMNHYRDNTSLDIGELFSCPDDHHPHLIDLGLPSGTKWACCNVDDDASKQSPTNYGGYYAWGETETKSTYTEDTYKYYQNWYVGLGDVISGTEYDVAHVKWGGDWRIPTSDQQDELLTNCNYKWITVNGVNGVKFTSKKNGKSIFLPAAGSHYSTGLINAGGHGYYWSSTQNPSNARYAFNLVFNSDNTYWSYYNRDDGQSVRPVVRN